MDYIWNVTGRCNLHCEYCWDTFKYENEISTLEAVKLINEIADEAEQMILFTGGEPLVREDLFELIEICKDKGFKYIKICTNGTLVDRFIDKIKKSAISEIHISLDGVHQDKNNYRGENSKVVKNIELLINNVDINVIKIVLAVVIDYNNLNEFENVLEFAKEKKIFVTYQFPALKEKNLKLRMDFLDKTAYKNLFDKIWNLHKKYNKQLDYFSNYYYRIAKDFYLNNKIPNRCRAGLEFEVISPCGKSYACYSCEKNGGVIGSCFNEKCLIWFRSEERARRIVQLLNKLQNK